MFEVSNSEKKMLVGIYIIGAFLILLSLTSRVFCGIIVVTWNEKTESSIFCENSYDCNFSLYVLFLNISIVIFYWLNIFNSINDYKN